LIRGCADEIMCCPDSYRDTNYKCKTQGLPEKRALSGVEMQWIMI